MSDVGRWKVRTSYQLGTSHRPLKRYTTTGTFTEIPGNTMERITVCKATAGHGTRKPHERYLSGHPSTKDFCKRHSSPLQVCEIVHCCELRRGRRGRGYWWLCDLNHLTVGGTLFQQKNTHKPTWKSPDRAAESQIDHIIINNRWRRSLNDVRVRRLADVGSDHHLLVAKLALKLRKVRYRACRKRHFDITRLNNPEVRKIFAISL